MVQHVLPHCITDASAIANKATNTRVSQILAHLPKECHVRPPGTCLLLRTEKRTNQITSPGAALFAPFTVPLLPFLLAICHQPLALGQHHSNLILCHSRNTLHNRYKRQFSKMR